MRKLQLIRVSFAGLGACVLLTGLTTASASSANLSRSYHSTGAIANGSIVSLDAGRSDYVVPSTEANGDRLLGVAVASKDSLLAVDASNSLVQVATTGTASALVSDVNGAIAVGDQIAVSPFQGVGMKAGAGMRIIGLAQSTLASSGVSVSKQTVTTTEGTSKQIRVGYVRVSIAPGTSTAGVASTSSGLQRLAHSLTGQIIPMGRLIAALIILVITLVSLIVLIYSSIYGTIISIGRNPLAKRAVFRSLGWVVFMVIITGSIGSFLIVLLLR